MDCEKWAVRHGDKIYELSEITVGIERQFVNFAKLEMLNDNAEWDTHAGHSELRRSLSSGSEYWSEGGMSQGIFGIFSSEKGAKYILRLCLGWPKKDIKDEEIDELYQASSDPTSSLSEAWQQVLAKRFPKITEDQDSPKKLATNPATSDLTGSTNS